jgi:type II secretory ATPase GspE/PulE/Tfp pilus assembly ATPase PilB-like protein
VVLAGPHDSGQAESAYSILSHINSPSVSISTIEDPIVYRIPGATQTQVNGRIGLTFSTGLRTLLRQDANVLFVSNLRDSETAKLAVEGALSGRLLVTGLHSTSATGAISHLLAAGIEPYLIAHTVQAVVGQRVVRRLCENCKQIFTPSEQELIGILKSLGIRTAAQLQRVRELEQQALEEKLVVGASPTTSATSITSLYRPSKDGCAECSHTGYKGGVGIYEVLEMSESVQRLILGSATSQVIEDQAVQEGMPTMQMDGLVKVLLGITSVDEVASATE